MPAKNGLKEYHRKRDFTKTKEPTGKKTKKRIKKPIFVVQEHHARNLHYDFRLEIDGVLKSWAVPKGPSLDPGEKRLAVETEDHPFDYAKFHGKIPKGEYGAGEVFIWDHGYWESEEEDPTRAYKKGKIEFSLKGKKLHGKWLLVRTKYRHGERGEGRNWLLIKRHDEKEASGPKVKKSVRKKKKVDSWPGFINPELPRLISNPPEDDGNWLHEMKLDGYRIQAHLRDGIAHLFTRGAQDWSNSFPFILKALGELPAASAILDGEIVAMNEGRPYFQGLQGSMKAKNDKHLVYFIFDLLYLDGNDLRELPLMERKEMLKNLMKGSPKNLIFSEHFFENSVDFFKSTCDLKLEGMVSKRADSPYKSGRNDLWVKTKCGQRQEFVIGGWTDPKGGRSSIGALLLGVYDGNDLRYVGKVGTGFDHKTLRELKKLLLPLEIDQSPFDINSPKGADIHWVEPDRVCEVSFAEWTEDGMLRTPVFQGIREDKPAKQILHERPKKKVKAKRREVSNPDKVLFESENITKQQVADYYQAIAPHMLPYIADRPLVLVRCPHGAHEKCFFQKHFTGNVPESFHTFPIQEGSGEGMYLSIDSADGLQELVQLNAFEIHSWNCHKDDLIYPDHIVMDFDPGLGIKWNQVVAGAFELKEMLEDLNLKSFVKLTGGKGLHIHIPLMAQYDWDQIKSFAQGLAWELVSRHPELYTASMSKKHRKGKIFVDYLRNSYGATAVVPYSLRAKPVSAVAMPVDWTELKKIKGPQVFTMEKALRKIKSRKQDPWKGMLKLKQKISVLTPVKKRKAA